MAALDYTYRYALPSSASSARVELSTCSSQGENPHFFEGTMVYPSQTAQMLVVLSQVVRTHFFLKRPPILDPVLTSSEEMLRLEGFSGCCGAYVRADLPSKSFDGELFGRGTTNVDFNEAMRRALRQIQDREKVSLAVGQDEVVLQRADGRTVEKKVRLPVRWLRAFGEVQSYQSNLKLKLEADATESLRFLRTLPKNAPPKKASYARRTGRALRLSQRAGKDGVLLRGTHRLAVLEPLMPRAEGLRVWVDPNTEVSGWEVFGKAGRFLLLLSPEVYRGFSGEGQMLESLASGEGRELVNRVRAQLRWQSKIDTGRLARQLGVEEREIRASLTVLGARGLAGYDLAQEAYFHRELPFDLELIEKLQPRLKAARKIFEGKGVERLEAGEFSVQGTDVRHHVRLGKENAHCSCPWFSKHRGSRGLCKHILAAQLYSDDC